MGSTKSTFERMLAAEERVTQLEKLLSEKKWESDSAWASRDTWKRVATENLDRAVKAEASREEFAQVLRQVLDRSSEESEWDLTLPTWARNWLEDALRHSQL